MRAQGGPDAQIMLKLPPDVVLRQSRVQAQAQAGQPTPNRASQPFRNVLWSRQNQAPTSLPTGALLPPAEPLALNSQQASSVLIPRYQLVLACPGLSHFKTESPVSRNLDKLGSGHLACVPALPDL